MNLIKKLGGYEKERNAVIHTVEQGFPLNVMYWATRDNGTFEIIDD